jgi:hypothetical protein
MSIWNFLFGGTDSQSTTTINPANGLPMIDNSIIDVAGNAYGTDSNDWSSSTIPDNSFSSSDWSSSSSSDSFSSSSFDSFSSSSWE